MKCIKSLSPLDWPPPAPGRAVVVLLLHMPGEAKVGDLGLELGGQEDVPGGKVAVDEALRFQVRHPTGYLSGLEKIWGT